MATMQLMNQTQPRSDGMQIQAVIHSQQESILYGG